MSALNVLDEHKNPRVKVSTS